METTDVRLAEWNEIQVYSGSMLDLADPKEEDIDITDIAHALSLLCRFTGHVKQFYSVAQHSVLVSRLVPKEMAFMGLMHDAHEAYIGDMSTPLKRMNGDYRGIEAMIWNVVADKFDIPYELPPEIKTVDIQMGLAEKDQLLVPSGVEWGYFDEYTPADVHIRPWFPQRAEKLFLERFEELYNA